LISRLFQLPHLKAVIQYRGQPTEPGVLSWPDLLEIGTEQFGQPAVQSLSLILPDLLKRGAVSLQNGEFFFLAGYARNRYDRLTDPGVLFRPDLLKLGRIAH
jgi:hypothetical protein